MNSKMLKEIFLLILNLATFCKLINGTILEFDTCGGVGLNVNGNDCQDGTFCYKLSKWYSQCRRDCPINWECNNNHDNNPDNSIKSSTILTSIKILTTTSSIATKAKNSNKNIITEDQFKNAITINGYQVPERDQYSFFVNGAEPFGNITTKRELAMFLAEVIWESGGLAFLEQIYCKETGCPNQYFTGVGLQGKSYYGRGYLQLSWDYNYKEASYSIYGDDRLLRNPEQVASDDSVAWITAFWFWRTRVGVNSNVQNGEFGAATNIINGGVECRGYNEDFAQKRFLIYKKILQIFEVNEAPNESGCYN